MQAAAPCVHCVWTRDGAGDLKGLAKPSRFRTGAVTKKKRKIWCDFYIQAIEVREVRKIAGVALSLRSGLRRPVRDFFRKIFGIAPGGVRGGRGQTRQRLRQTRTIHGASSFFQWTPLLEALR